ncbi:MAG: hypothetical protein ACOY90_01880 [Candidatus Zhuqueibacterota bacterium]
MKDILLIGELAEEDTNLDLLFKRPDFRIYKTNRPLKAMKMLEKCTPDFFMCTGEIKQTPDGKYYLQLNE